MRWEITKMVRGPDAYFTVRWSPFVRAEKYAIHTGVPAMGGIAELYWRDAAGKLNQFCVARSWYGGLRSLLREHTDPALEKDPFRLTILRDHGDKIFFRWSLSESNPDMEDILYFFQETLAPGLPTATHSGRYGRIFLNEIDAGKLVTI
ncbi:MAG TPA: hypothetical protein VLH39_08965 [Magnetospirillaceae bacterium]|nr:hypothetical protein [Magnetospirillaceae bacterium]